MEREEFVMRYGGVYEHSQWVADEAFDEVVDPYDMDSLAMLFCEIVDNASFDRRLALIRGHPDLAGRAAVAGELSDESGDEQASAGIDRCTPAEFARFQDLNDAYKEKFGFPFVMAVRFSNRAEIISAFERRIHNGAEEEFERAVSEIHKIAKLRLDAMKEYDH